MKIIKLSPFSLIILGLMIFEMGGYLSIFYGISPIVTNMIGILISLFGFIRISFKSISSLGFAYQFLLFLTLIMILRGSLLGNFLPQYGSCEYDTSLYSIIRHSVSKHHLFAFLMPLAALISIQRIDLDVCKKIGVFCCIISLFLAFKHIPELILGSTWNERQLLIGDESIGIRELTNSVFIGFGLTLMMSYCFQYLNPRIKWLFPITLFSFLLCTIAGAGRGNSVLLFGYFIVFIFLWYKYPLFFSSRGQIKKRSRFFTGLFILFFVVFFLYLLLHTTYFSFLFERLFENDSFNTLSESGREQYVDNLIKDFNGAVYPWIIGRGINGTYISGEGYMRDVIEWGYLYLILKGGLLYLITYVYLHIKAGFLGLRKSKNLLCKALAFICLFKVISLIPFGLPTVSIEFFLSWIGIGVLNNKNIREMNDENIKKYLRL